MFWIHSKISASLKNKLTKTMGHGTYQAISRLYASYNNVSYQAYILIVFNSTRNEQSIRAFSGINSVAKCKHNA